MRSPRGPSDPLAAHAGERSPADSAGLEAAAVVAANGEQVLAADESPKHHACGGGYGLHRHSRSRRPRAAREPHYRNARSAAAADRSNEPRVRALASRQKKQRHVAIEFPLQERRAGPGRPRHGPASRTATERSSASRRGSVAETLLHRWRRSTCAHPTQRGRPALSQTASVSADRRTPSRGSERRNTHRVWLVHP